MYNVKGNFRNKWINQSLICPLPGCSEEDTQAHIFRCSALQGVIRDSSSKEAATYEHIFSSDPDKLFNVGQLILKLTTLRKELIENEI